MLKWTVYGKKTSSLPVKRAEELDAESKVTYTNEHYNNKPYRRSLDGATVKQSKKPHRYQRRSLGSSSAKKAIRNVDKENLNYIGNTPNVFKEGFVKTQVLKDVSNITPTTPKNQSISHDTKKWTEKDANAPDLPATPITYSRKIHEAKKRKLEMTKSLSNETLVVKPEVASTNSDSENEDELDPEKLFEMRCDILRSSFSVAKTKNSINKLTRSKSISTTKLCTENLVEIEYPSKEVLSCKERPMSFVEDEKRSTLPIFGYKMFIENPLYFNRTERLTDRRPFKRTRKKTNEFESSYKSPAVGTMDVHTMIRSSCSPLPITPLSTKLAELQFSAMSTHSKIDLANLNYDSSLGITRIENPLTVTLLKDDETSTEMENKFIFGASAGSETESTVSASQMGDVTLEKMIEDIIKSSKKVKCQRKVIMDQDFKAEFEFKNIANCRKNIIFDKITQKQSEKHEKNMRVDVFINPVKDAKTSMIKEARTISLSRENTPSPKNSPSKKIAQANQIFSEISYSMNGTFILDNAQFNEREVKTPDVVLIPSRKSSKSKTVKSLDRSYSMSAAHSRKSNLQTCSYESSPDVSCDGLINTRLKRQRCVRRKKSTLSHESSIQKKIEKNSILTLEKGIPSPSSVMANSSFYDPLSSSFDCVIGMPTSNDFGTQVIESEIIDKSNPSSHSVIFRDKANISHSSVMLNHEAPKNGSELFGLTLENGIPSPITPVQNLKRPNNNFSDERAHKASRMEDDYFKGTESLTPVIEYKTSRRCLTFSSEEASFNSLEDKRRSTASSRFEKSEERIVKGTIDLSIKTRDNIVDVHVIRCRELYRPGAKLDDINAYAKVVISGTSECQPLANQRSVFQRTSVLYGKKEPEFQRHLRLPLPSTIQEDQLIHVSVWHRDKKYRRSEFLGCVSFPLKDAIDQDVAGTFQLQAQVGRDKRPVGPEAKDVVHPLRMGDHTEAGNYEGDSRENTGLAQNGTAPGAPGVAGAAAGGPAAQLQREADELLFLRYLELDPEDSAPKKGRQGRTPFTTTRKLQRSSSGGFGFTVVWTRPARVERVAAGGAAEGAGLKAGDYLVFIGNRNVVVAPEEEVRQIVKSAGQTLTMETYRRSQNGVPAAPRTRGSNVSYASEPRPEPSPRADHSRTVPSPAPAHRPPTACSSTSQSLDARRKLHLPQVTFSKEALGGIEQRRKALAAVVAREQQYVSGLQFGLTRFVQPLADRADLIAPLDHQLLFQNIEENMEEASTEASRLLQNYQEKNIVQQPLANCADLIRPLYSQQLFQNIEKILRLSEDILDQIGQDEGDIQTSTVVGIYLQKIPQFLSLYKKYCLGLKRADCVLVKKSKDPSGAFVRFCNTPPIPRRKPDITSLVHKPLEQFRELQRTMRAAAAASGAGPYEQLEKRQLQAIVEQLQAGYQDVTAGSGLMGLAGDGKPLLSVADLESRLVFTRCKPFVLNTPGRQWIFGGELSRVDGRTVRPYWALLFSDLLLFTTVSRDKVLFVTEEPILLTAVAEASFSLRKKVAEFRLVLGRTGGESPLASCAPRLPRRRETLVLRAPSLDLRAVWQSLLQRQIHRAHTMTGTPLGSPLDSPDPQLTFSLATLDSQQRQTRRSSAEASAVPGASQDRSSTRGSRGAAIHLAQWMTQLPETEEWDRPEPDLETWSVEELRKRSKELNLIDVASLISADVNNKENAFNDKNDIERSPSKSSNSGSQITVRTSPIVIDKIPVCRQCHKKCLSKPNSPQISQKENGMQKKSPNQLSPQSSNQSNSNKSSQSLCSTNCINRQFNVAPKTERKIMKLINPEDAPTAAKQVISSIEQNQKLLKSTSYIINTDSPILSQRSKTPSSKSLLELKQELLGSARSPSPCSSSRNNSPLSTSHTTCSSIVFNSSTHDLRMSNSNLANTVQCVIAQEKYLNEVKCAESVILSKNRNSPTNVRKEELTKIKAENMLSKVLGVNIITKRENIQGCQKTSPVFLKDSHIANEDFNCKPKFSPSKILVGKTDTRRFNGDINANTKNDATDVDEWGQLMLMGLSAINPAARLMRVDPFRKSDPFTVPSSTPISLDVTNDGNSVPNIAVEPPTPDYIYANKTDVLVDESPDSPQPEEPPYISLKRYGTMSSLERIPSDETDDGNPRLHSDEDNVKLFNSSTAGPATGGGLMGWTARAGSFVAEKMNIFGYTDTPSTTTLPQKQQSFLERYLGDWRGTVVEGEAATEGEGSGASGEDAWGTPSSGDLSDNAFPDSDHGTLSSPTKSSSSYAGDDDTELMMDELLMAPPITGPTTLRPLLPRRRLEPLLEEDCSDSGSEDNKQTPTNENQAPAPAPRALSADDGCRHTSAPTFLLSGFGSGVGRRGRGAEGGEGSLTPDITPTNDTPSLMLHEVLSDVAGGGAATGACAGEAASPSSASTPSTLDHTAIHNPPTPPSHTRCPTTEDTLVEAPLPEERLSPRAEMRLALDQGKDMLADQDDNWGTGACRVDLAGGPMGALEGGACDPWLWRRAVRRVASTEAVPLLPHSPSRGPRPHTTSRSSVYAWNGPESAKASEMERLAAVEARTMRSRTRSPCQNGKILGFLRRRASSDSPRRDSTLSQLRPFSPRRTAVSNNGYYKICFVNGSV